MQETIREINEYISARNIWEWAISSYNNYTLAVRGSFDLCYYHEIEIVFGEVGFIRCQTSWTWPTRGHVSISVSEEIKKIRKVYSEADEGSKLFLIHADTENPFEVVAARISVKYGPDQCAFNQC